MIELDEERQRKLAAKKSLVEEGGAGSSGKGAERKRPVPKIAEDVEDGVEGKMLRLPRGLWDRIDAYWHDERLPSRTAAVRALIERGLEKGK